MITDLVLTFALLFAAVIALIAAVYTALIQRRKLSQEQVDYQKQLQGGE